MGKHVRTKATDISQKTRKLVALRDNGLCIICGRMGISNAHIVPRSQGGLGIEQNIVTLCPQCHHEFDNGKESWFYKEKIYEYIKKLYPNWDAENMKFKKYNYCYKKER